MGLFDLLSHLEEEFLARARVATRDTVDDVSDALDSVCSLAFASCSFPAPSPGFSPLSSRTVFQDDSMVDSEDVSCARSSSCSSVAFKTASQDDSDSDAEEVSTSPFSGFPSVSSQAASQDVSVSYGEEVSSEGKSRLQDLEQAHDPSDAQTLAPVTLDHDDSLTSLRQDLRKEVPVLSCEQNPCGAGEQTLPSEASKNPKKEEEGKVEAQHSCEAAFLFQRSGKAGRLSDLDTHCLANVMRFSDNRTQQACSLVSREWLEASNFARSQVRVRVWVEKLPVLLQRFGRLQRLHLDHHPLELGDVHTVPASAAFNDTTMRLIAKHCPLLQELDLTGCWAFTDEGLAAVLMGCSDLRALKFAWCHGFSGEVFSIYFSGKLERITFTYCAGLTNDGVEAIARACPGLRELSLVKCQGPSVNSGIRKVALLCSDLEKVNILRCGVTDDTLLTFAFSCKKLHTFCIGHESNISGYGIDLLRSYLPCLRNLGLKNNPSVQLLSGNRFFTPLKRLSLIWYAGADKHLEQLLGEGTVEELIFVDCFRLSDVSIDRVFTQCRQLRRLVIRESGSITAQVFEAYAKSQSTAELEIRQCSLISKDLMPKGLQLSGKLSVFEGKNSGLDYSYAF